MRDLVTRRVRDLVVEVELGFNLTSGAQEGDPHSEGEGRGESEGESGRGDKEDAGERHGDSSFEDVGEQVGLEEDEGQENSASSTLTT